jgi:hypothetical protein
MKASEEKRMETMASVGPLLSLLGGRARMLKEGMDG